MRIRANGSARHVISVCRAPCKLILNDDLTDAPVPANKVRSGGEGTEGRDETGSESDSDRNETMELGDAGALDTQHRPPARADTGDVGVSAADAGCSRTQIIRDDRQEQSVAEFSKLGCLFSCEQGCSFSHACELIFTVRSNQMHSRCRPERQ